MDEKEEKQLNEINNKLDNIIERLEKAEKVTDPVLSVANIVSKKLATLIGWIVILSVLYGIYNFVSIFLGKNPKSIMKFFG